MAVRRVEAISHLAPARRHYGDKSRFSPFVGRDFEISHTVGRGTTVETYPVIDILFTYLLPEAFQQQHLERTTKKSDSPSSNICSRGAVDRAVVVQSVPRPLPSRSQCPDGFRCRTDFSQQRGTLFAICTSGMSQNEPRFNLLRNPCCTFARSLGC